MEASIIVALVTGGFAIVVALINKFRHQNHDDHASVMTVLKEVRHEVRDVGAKVDRHIEWHVQGGQNVGVAKRDKVSRSQKK